MSFFNSVFCDYYYIDNFNILIRLIRRKIIKEEEVTQPLKYSVA